MDENKAMLLTLQIQEGQHCHDRNMQKDCGKNKTHCTQYCEKNCTIRAIL